MRIVHYGEIHEMEPLHGQWSAQQITYKVDPSNAGGYKVYDPEGDQIMLIPPALIPHLQHQAVDIGRLELLIDFIITQRSLSYHDGKQRGREEYKLQLRELLGIDEVQKGGEP
jgi:hypothetical protein